MKRTVKLIKFPGDFKNLKFYKMIKNKFWSYSRVKMSKIKKAPATGKLQVLVK